MWKKVSCKTEIDYFTSNGRSAILYRTGVWFMRGKTIGILNPETSMVIAVCEVLLKDRKTTNDLMQVFGLN